MTFEDFELDFPPRIFRLEDLPPSPPPPYSPPPVIFGPRLDLSSNSLYDDTPETFDSGRFSECSSNVKTSPRSNSSCSDSSMDDEFIKWLCPICDKFDEEGGTTNFGDVERHMLQRHFLPLLDIDYSMTDDFVCVEPFCSDRFVDVLDFACHVGYLHKKLSKVLNDFGLDPVLATPLLKIYDDKREMRYRCLGCPLRFSSERDLQFHKDVDHDSVLAAVVSGTDCSQCQKKFRTRLTCLAHIAWVHTEGS